MDMGTYKERRQVAHYFEYSDHQIEVLEDGLQEVQFGEFLVERRVVTRQQLFRALTEQDRHPGVRLGEIVAALGYAPYSEIDRLLSEFHGLAVVEVS
jgi:hypothetical protein